jgi:hypothetical protein
MRPRAFMLRLYTHLLRYDSCNVRSCVVKIRSLLAGPSRTERTAHYDTKQFTSRAILSSLTMLDQFVAAMAEVGSHGGKHTYCTRLAYDCVLDSTASWVTFDAPQRHFL